MRNVAIGLCATLVATVGSAAELEVRVNGLNSAEGELRLALFADEVSFEAGEPLAGVFLPANPDGLSIALGGLPRGNYAVSVFHDENGNGLLDRNLVGAPREPYGFSNDARGRFGPPRFEEMRFSLGDDPMALEINLR